MNVGFLALLVIAGWALLSIIVAVTVGEAASTRDGEETRTLEGLPSPWDEQPRRIAS